MTPTSTQHEVYLINQVLGETTLITREDGIFEGRVGFALASRVDYDWLELKARQIDDDGTIRNWLSATLGGVGIGLSSLLSSLEREPTAVRSGWDRTFEEGHLVHVELWSVCFELKPDDIREVNLGRVHPRLWARYHIGHEQLARPGGLLVRALIAASTELGLILSSAVKSVTDRLLRPLGKPPWWNGPGIRGTRR